MLELEARAEPSRLMSWLSPLLAVMLMLGGGVLVFWALGKDPVEGFRVFFLNPLKDFYSLFELLLKATTLMLCAIGLAIGFRANVWNIGAEGQFMLGAESMATITIKKIIESVESMAPGSYQEEYDNSGLLTGHPADEVKGILVTLDCTEDVVEEALTKSCNLIVAHHPILFRGIKRLTGQTYVERVLIKAIRNNIAIYAIHTNLDNVIQRVNKKIAERIGLINLQILLPKKNTLTKLVTFIPKEHKEKVTASLHMAGAGQIGNYKNCSFSIAGEGAFMPTENAKPFKGLQGVLEKAEEVRVGCSMVRN